MAVSVAAVGDNCIDRYLRPVELVHVGGNAVNVAVGLAAAGLQVMYAGAVGSDADGRLVLSALATAGVDTTHVQVVPNGQTGVTLVELTADGDRVFLEERLGTTGTYRPAAVTQEALAECAWVHGAGLHADPELLTRLSGPRISYDFSHVQLSLLPRLAPALDIAFISAARGGREQALELARQALQHGARSAVVTLGRDGSVAYDGRLTEHPAQPVEVVDTLGAGDALIAEVIAARLDGAELAEAVDAGGRAAARTCSHYGAWRAA